MKLLLVTPDFVPDVGGVQRLLYNFVRHTKFKVTVIAPFAKRNPKSEALNSKQIPNAKFQTTNFDKRQGFKIIRAGNRQLVYLPFLFLKSIVIICKERPDIVLCGHIIVSPIGYLIEKIFGIPYAVYTYGLEIMVKRRIFSYILKHAITILTISEFCKNYLLKFGISEHKIKKVYPGIDIDFFNPNIDAIPVIEKYKLHGKKIILTVARMDATERYKGHDETLLALRDVIKVFPSVKFIIVGDGTDRPRLEAVVRELNLSDYVLFTGKVTDLELRQLYVASDFLIMVSKEVKSGSRLKAEGFGIVYAEAGACGKPVIAGKSGGAVEAVIDGVTGLVVEPAEESISTAILKLIRDENLRKKLGSEARCRVVHEMHTAKIAGEIEETLLRIGRR